VLRSAAAAAVCRQGGGFDKGGGVAIGGGGRAIAVATGRAAAFMVAIATPPPPWLWRLRHRPPDRSGLGSYGYYGAPYGYYDETYYDEPVVRWSLAAMPSSIAGSAFAPTTCGPAPISGMTVAARLPVNSPDGQIGGWRIPCAILFHAPAQDKVCRRALRTRTP